MPNENEQSNVFNAFSPEGIRDELGLTDPKSILEGSGQDSALQGDVQEFTRLLQLACAGDRDALHRIQLKVGDLGVPAQKKAKWLSGILNEPLRAFAQKGENSDSIAGDLDNLKSSLQEMVPERFSSASGWFTRHFGWLPGFRTPLQKYCSAYQNARVLIEGALRSLLDSKEQLARDDAVLVSDQKRLWEVSLELEKEIKLGGEFDEKLASELDWDLTMDETTRRFMQEDLLLPLRQRMLALQQQLAVSQQGIVAVEIIVRNNRELVRAIEHARNVAAAALQTAAAVAMALTQQKSLVRALAGLNQTTSDLVEDTSRQLESQETPVQKQMSTARSDVSGLGEASEKISAAMESISRKRLESTQHLSKTILEMEKLLTDASSLQSASSEA